MNSTIGEDAEHPVAQPAAPEQPAGATDDGDMQPATQESPAAA